jgi:hypothetical protein
MTALARVKLQLFKFLDTGAPMHPRRFRLTSFDMLSGSTCSDATYTYLGLRTGLELTGALGLTLNAPNTVTNYQSGAELHFEWALNQPCRGRRRLLLSAGDE